jgi:hypothetical protein
MRLRTLVPFAAIALLAIAACKKKPLYFVVHVSDIKPKELTITIAGRPVVFDASADTESAYGHYANIQFAPNTIPATTPAEVTFDTACGKQTVHVNGEIKSSEKNYVDIDISNKTLPAPTHLLIDPAISALEVGGTPPNPIPKKLDVRFGTCPRKIKVDGDEVTLPDVSDKKYVLVAKNPKICYLSGEVLFGKASDGCRPDSSKRLTGEAAYVLNESPAYLFEGVPLTTKVYYGKCTNSTFLQRCK